MERLNFFFVFLVKLHRGKMSESPNLQVFNFADIYKATNCFSIEYKLGEGGYGPVYKVICITYQVCFFRTTKQPKKQVECAYILFDFL